MGRKLRHKAKKLWRKVKKLIEPVVDLTKEEWLWLWGSEGFPDCGCVDYLRDVGSRTHVWLKNFMDNLLNTINDCCPCCRDLGELLD